MGTSKNKSEAKHAKKEKKKSSKRKREEDPPINDLDGGVPLDHADAPALHESIAASAHDSTTIKTKRKKKNKNVADTDKVHKPTQAGDEDVLIPDHAQRESNEEHATAIPSTKEQASEKDLSDATSEEDVEAGNLDTATGDGVPLESSKENPKLDDTEAAPGQYESKPSKNHRFIVFVGNLPYNATTEAIQAHFSSVNPISIRHRTHKEDPSRSKGFAFLEFDGYERMKTCLKNFHHSRFDDGKGKDRRINVELTETREIDHLTIKSRVINSAGGGGKKSETRHSKLKAKNSKLNEERKRRAEQEGEQAGTTTGTNNNHSKRDGGAKRGGASQGGKGPRKGERRDKDHQKKDAKGGEVLEEGEGNIHPSRRNRVRS